MTERAYTVREIDELRRTCDDRYGRNTTYFAPDGWGNWGYSYKPAEKIQQIEECVRTYMLAGITGPEIREQDQIEGEKAWQSRMFYSIQYPTPELVSQWQKLSEQQSQEQTKTSLTSSSGVEPVTPSEKSAPETFTLQPVTLTEPAKVESNSATGVITRWKAKILYALGVVLVWIGWSDI